MPADPQPAGIWSPVEPKESGSHWCRHKQALIPFCTSVPMHGHDDENYAERFEYGPRIPSPEQLTADAASLKTCRELLRIALPPPAYAGFNTLEWWGERDRQVAALAPQPEPAKGNT